MPKITSKLHLHFFTVILAAVCVFCHSFSLFALTYATMLVHELSHLAAAKCLGLCVDKICLYPFGVNLKLKNKMVHSLTDECILYLSGPLSNAVMAVVFLALCKIFANDTLRYLYVSNTALAFVNMLPIMPLDGGILSKKILLILTNEKTARRIMNAVSAIMILILLALFVYGAAAYEFNFSVLLLCVFLIGNFFVQEEKYDADFVRKVVFCGSGKKKKVSHIIKTTENTKDLIHKFRGGRYNIVYCIDNKGHITDIMTEEEIINSMLAKTPGGSL